jgi:hypothetical protein
MKTSTATNPKVNLPTERTIGDCELMSQEIENLRTSLTEMTTGQTDGPFNSEELTAYLDSLKGC